MPTNTGVDNVGEWYTKYRHCSEYTKGTQARSPNASMKPKPSVVMSIVVKMAVWVPQASKTRENKETWHAYLIQKSVENVVELEHANQEDGGRDSTELVLLHNARNVDDDPADQPRTQLAEKLPIKAANARVQLAADVQVVHRVACGEGRLH
jgi:hypothetical protein